MPADNHLPANTRLSVVLCWHMHQPEYRDRRTGIYQRPWTYLRAIKDYTDMAAHLEQTPSAHAVVNFTPILLEQILDYASQLDSYLKLDSALNSSHTTALRDPLLAALAAPVFGQQPEQRQQLLNTCANGHVHRFVGQHGIYGSMNDFVHDLTQHPERIRYVNDEFFSDLLVWYHLSWLGETVRRDDPRVRHLLNKGQAFSAADRLTLLSVIGEQIAAIIPRYRALADTSRVELAMTPYAHPLAPLLVDLGSAHEATPGLPLPELTTYPDGEQRLHWHIAAGQQLFEQCFGKPPVGCWPAEGAISDAVLTQLDACGFQWTASGAGVLSNSLNNSETLQSTETALYHPYKIGQHTMSCFFRDDELSDLIGFTYSSWHGDDAVANLIQRLESIATRCRHEQDAVATIIMDGENAWEHYPDNGFHFLRALYRRLASHPKLNLTTFSNCRQNHLKALPKITAGSWIYGNLTTWIGGPEKNRAWNMLIEAKQSFDRAIRENNLSEHQVDAAEKQLAVCEGSDWFWWPGDYNAKETVIAFDDLFRVQLRTLYEIIAEPEPGYLAYPFTQSGHSGSSSGETMRKTQ